MRAFSNCIDSYEIDGKVYEVFGIYYHDTPEGEYDYYDVDCDGECINLGDALYTEPTRKFIIEYIKKGE